MAESETSKLISNVLPIRGRNFLQIDKGQVHMRRQDDKDVHFRAFLDIDPKSFKILEFA